MQYSVQYPMEELFPLLQELTEKYTGKESTSITYEKAQQLLGAVLYTIYESTGGKKVITKQDGIIREMSAKEAYDTGYRMLREKVEQSSRKYAELMTEFESYGNIAYQETVEQGISAFFKRYDIRFRPQDHIISLDYPVLCSLENLQGIDRIAEYLACIQIEQKFLQSFPVGYVENTLEQYHTNYQELFLNIPEILMQRILPDMLLKKAPSVEKRKQEEYDRLTDMILKEEKETLKNHFQSLLKILVEQISPGNQAMYQYLSEGLANITEEMRNRAEHNCYMGI